MLADEVLDWRLGTKEGVLLPTFALTAIDSPETKFVAKERVS